MFINIADFLTENSKGSAILLKLSSKLTTKMLRSLKELRFNRKGELTDLEGRLVNAKPIRPPMTLSATGPLYSEKTEGVEERIRQLINSVGCVFANAYVTGPLFKAATGVVSRDYVRSVQYYRIKQ